MAVASLSWSPLVLGSMATWMTGAGNVIDSSVIGLRRIAQRLARGGHLQTHHGDDLAGAHGVDLFALVGVHPVDLADPLLLVLARVQHVGAGGQGSGVHPQVGQLAQVRVRHDLERQGRERRVVAWARGSELDGLVADLVAGRSSVTSSGDGR
jgi:hypothetical protein